VCPPQPLRKLLRLWAVEAEASFLDGAGEGIFMKMPQISSSLAQWVGESDDYTCVESINTQSVGGVLAELNEEQFALGLKHGLERSVDTFGTIRWCYLPGEEVGDWSPEEFASECRKIVFAQLVAGRDADARCLAFKSGRQRVLGQDRGCPFHPSRSDVGPCAEGAVLRHTEPLSSRDRRPGATVHAARTCGFAPLLNARRAPPRRGA